MCNCCIVMTSLLYEWPYYDATTIRTAILHVPACKSYLHVHTAISNKRPFFHFRWDQSYHISVATRGTSDAYICSEIIIPGGCCRSSPEEYNTCRNGCCWWATWGSSVSFQTYNNCIMIWLRLIVLEIITLCPVIHYGKCRSSCERHSCDVAIICVHAKVTYLLVHTYFWTSRKTVVVIIGDSSSCFIL